MLESKTGCNSTKVEQVSATQETEINSYGNSGQTLKLSEFLRDRIERGIIRRGTSSRHYRGDYVTGGVLQGESIMLGGGEIYLRQGLSIGGISVGKILIPVFAVIFKLDLLCRWSM